MKQGKTFPVGVPMLGIAALFLAGFLLLVVLGTQSYLRCEQTQQRNQQERAIPASISAGLRSFDSLDGVTVRTTASGPVLELHDADTGYALRYYALEGELLTDYARLDAALRPEQAQVLGRTQTFSVERLGEALLCITTDQGRILYRLRSEGGAR